MKVTKVPPIFPSRKAQVQDKYTEAEYFPRKKTETSFKSLLEKELQSPIGIKINIKY